MEPSLNCGSPATTYLNHGTALEREKIYLKNISRCSWYRAVKKHIIIMKSRKKWLFVAGIIGIIGTHSADKT